MRVTTPRCRVCGNSGVLDNVDALGFVRWAELGENIQDALPQLDADQRELLMSGTHPQCWVRMFGPEEDD